MTNKNKAEITKDHPKTIQLTYEEALNLIIKDLNKIKKDRGLKKWCEEKNLSYHALSSLKNGKNARPQPNKVLEILKNLGYTGVNLQKVYSYTMEIDLK